MNNTYLGSNHGNQQQAMYSSSSAANNINKESGVVPTEFYCSNYVTAPAVTTNVIRKKLNTITGSGPGNNVSIELDCRAGSGFMKKGSAYLVMDMLMDFDRDGDGLFVGMNGDRGLIDRSKPIIVSETLPDGTVLTAPFSPCELPSVEFAEEGIGRRHPRFLTGTSDALKAQENVLVNGKPIQSINNLSILQQALSAANNNNQDVTHPMHEIRPVHTDSPYVTYVERDKSNDPNTIRIRYRVHMGLDNFLFSMSENSFPLFICQSLQYNFQFATDVNNIFDPRYARPKTFSVAEAHFCYIQQQVSSQYETSFAEALSRSGEQYQILGHNVASTTESLNTGTSSLSIKRSGVVADTLMLVPYTTVGRITPLYPERIPIGVLSMAVNTASTSDGYYYPNYTEKIGTVTPSIKSIDCAIPGFAKGAGPHSNERSLPYTVETSIDSKRFNESQYRIQGYPEDRLTRYFSSRDIPNISAPTSINALGYKPHDPTNSWFNDPTFGGIIYDMRCTTDPQQYYQGQRVRNSCDVVINIEPNRAGVEEVDVKNKLSSQAYINDRVDAQGKYLTFGSSLKSSNIPSNLNFFKELYDSKITDDLLDKIRKPIPITSSSRNLVAHAEFLKRVVDNASNINSFSSLSANSKIRTICKLMSDTQMTPQFFSTMQHSNQNIQPVYTIASNILKAVTSTQVLTSNDGTLNNMLGTNTDDFLLGFRYLLEIIGISMTFTHVTTPSPKVITSVTVTAFIDHFNPSNVVIPGEGSNIGMIPIPSAPMTFPQFMTLMTRLFSGDCISERSIGSDIYVRKHITNYLVNGLDALNFTNTSIDHLQHDICKLADTLVPLHDSQLLNTLGKSAMREQIDLDIPVLLRVLNIARVMDSYSNINSMVVKNSVYDFLYDFMNFGFMTYSSTANFYCFAPNSLFNIFLSTNVGLHTKYNQDDIRTFISSNVRLRYAHDLAEQNPVPNYINTSSVPVVPARSLLDLVKHTAVEISNSNTSRTKQHTIPIRIDTKRQYCLFMFTPTVIKLDGNGNMTAIV